MVFFSRDNLPRIKNGTHVINPDDSKVTPWVLLFIDRNKAVNFDSFRIEYIPQEVLRKAKNKSITHNILKIQDDSSIILFYCFHIIYDCRKNFIVRSYQFNFSR